MNCNTKEYEKKEIYEKIKIYFGEDENLEDNFNMIFDDVVDHNKETTKIIDEENESFLFNYLKKNKYMIENIISNSDNKVRINKLYDILFENNIFLKKNVFIYLCYKLKTDECDSLYDIEIKGLLKYIK